jgi:glycerol uptake facilitator-like aquaporin
MRYCSFSLLTLHIYRICRFFNMTDPEETLLVDEKKDVTRETEKEDITDDKEEFMDPFIDPQMPGNGYIYGADLIMYNEATNMNKNQNGVRVRVWYQGLKESIGCFILFLMYGLIRANYKLSEFNFDSRAVTVIGSPSSNFSTLDPPPIYSFRNTGDEMVIVSNTTYSVENQIGYLLDALSFALIFLVVIRVFPGCTFNPMVSIAQFFLQWTNYPKYSTDTNSIKGVTRAHILFARWEIILNLIGQFIGHVAANIVLYLMLQEETTILLETIPSAKISHDVVVILYEAIGTFILLGSIAAYSRPFRMVSTEDQTTFISTVYFILMLGLIPYTSCSLNIIRSLVSSIFKAIYTSSAMHSSVVFYMIGQGAGAAIAIVCINLYISTLLNKKADREEKEKGTNKE